VNLSRRMAVADELATLTTEAYRSELAGIDQLPTAEIVRLMAEEDAKVPAAVAACGTEVATAIDGIAARMERGGRLVYVGAGTPGRLGAVDASECPPTFSTSPDQVVALIAGGPTALTRAIEGAEDDPKAGRADLIGIGLTAVDTVVGISASGRTPYVAGALRYAREVGAFTVALACNAGSLIGHIAEVRIEVVVGPELIAGSTRLKAGTAQKLVLNMLSTVSMVRLGKTYGNLMVDLRASNDKLRARAQRIVSLATGRNDVEVSKALRDADGTVKTAIVMLLRDVDRAEADRRLAATEGRLRAALDSAAAEATAIDGAGRG
jgi:N-acetylmuramic acid 6-phosphate etherase